MSATSSVISSLSNASNASSSSGTDRTASDKFTFLKLLVTQLQNQDPLNPTDDTDFVAQLAQFTSLEQLQEINEGVGTLNNTVYQGQLMTATSFIGKAVVVNGSQVIKTNDSDGNIVTTYMYYTVEDSFEKGYVTIMDGDTIVRQDTIDATQAGTHYYEWNGKNDKGAEAATGVYTMIIAAVDKNDKSVLVDTKYEAQVISVYIEDGVYHLSLTGNRTVPLTDVTEVGQASTTTTSSETTTYSGLAADQAAIATMAAESAAGYDSSLDSITESAAAKTAADAAIAAAAKARTAADSAAKIAEEAKAAAKTAETAATLKEYNSAKESADAADALADAAEASAASAKAKALNIDPTLDY